MTTVPPPSEQFTGVYYNPSFWISSSTTLSQAVANTLYLRKTTTDSASALETFNGGIASQNIAATSLTTQANLFTTQTSGTVQLGNSSVSVHCSNIDCNGNSINNATNPTTGNITICNNQTSGTLSLGTNASRTGAITIGANANTINLGGYLTPSYTTMPSSNTQIGYKLSTSLTNTTVGVSATLIGGTFPTIPAGVWLIQGYAMLPTATGNVVHLTINNSLAINTGAVNSAPTNATNNAYVEVSTVQAFTTTQTTWGLYAQATASSALTNISIVITRLA